MEWLAFGGLSNGGYHIQQVALLHQRKKLQDEISAIKERQRRVQRHERRQIILKQVQQLEEALNQVRNDKIPGSGVETASPRPTTPTARDERLRLHSVEWMLTKLMHQNEELQAIVKTQHANNRPSSPVNQQSWKTQLKAPSTSLQSPEVDTTETVAGFAARLTGETREDSPPKAVQATPEVRGWSTLENLPEIEWTDQDEELLEQLVRDETGQAGGMLALPGATADENSAVGEVGDSDLASILNRKQQQQDRHESRRKLAQLFDTSVISNNSGIRRPRWRIEYDTANGIVRPFGENGEGATSEQPMSTLQIFRSVVIAVMAVLELQHLLYEKRLRFREKSLQDFEPVLNLYFDATRFWLGKLVKVPLLSIVGDPTLDIDVSGKVSLFRAGKGLPKWLGRSRSVATTEATQALVGSSTTGEQNRLVRLKVRVKGIVDAIVKAIDKSDVPTGILDFWRRLTTDGLFFPAKYPVFEMERQSLDLDEFGATRRIYDDYIAPSGRHYPRFQIILVNFMLLRILVPHVVIRPWEIGVGSAGTPKAVSANLRSVASLLYAIIARLSPLPPVGVDVGLSVGGGIRRRSVDVVPINESQDTVQSSPGTHMSNQGEGTRESNRFLSIAEIHSSLIHLKHFPLDQLELFVIEQEIRLRDSIRGLYAKLHPRASEAGDSSAT